MRRSTYVFQPVQVLVPLATDVAFVRLLLFHAKSSRIRCRGLGVNNRECAITIFMELLSLVAMGLVVPRIY